MVILEPMTPRMYEVGDPMSVAWVEASIAARRARRRPVPFCDIRAKFSEMAEAGQ